MIHLRLDLTNLTNLSPEHPVHLPEPLGRDRHRVGLGAEIVAFALRIGFDELF
jgi:hypothetical protein